MSLKSKTKKYSSIIFFAIVFLVILPISPVNASIADDAKAYEKYPLYAKYEKKQLYDKYKKFQRIKKQLGFDNAKKKQEAKDGWMKYKLYLKDKAKNRAFAQYLPQYRAYKKYRKYSDYSKYKKYKNYDNDKYEGYKNYGSRSYKDGYNRYKIFMKDLGNVTSNRGPEIKVGLFSYSKDDINFDNLGNAIGASSKITLTANKAFSITNCSSTTIGQIAIGDSAKVSYLDGSDGTLSVTNGAATLAQTDVPTNICFQAADGKNEEIIFDVNKPGSDYDNYRGKIKIQHSNTSDNTAQTGNSRRIWVINMLPLELYVWGFGEIGGGVEQHSLAMIVTARTYARWYLQPTVTKWHEEGFNVLSTSSSQIYHGYDYEKNHATIPALAKKTNGIIMKNQDSDIVLAAYGSWTDGKTRKYEDGLFGSSCDAATAGNTSTIYPELSSVSDPYGKHPSLGTCALSSAGNHMVGLSANGSLILARDHDWSWTRILSYYYSKISIVKEY